MLLAGTQSDHSSVQKPGVTLLWNEIGLGVLQDIQAVARTGRCARVKAELKAGIQLSQGNHSFIYLSSHSRNEY